jgi:hypothetical protein
MLRACGIEFGRFSDPCCFIRQTRYRLGAFLLPGLLYRKFCLAPFHFKVGQPFKHTPYLWPEY